MTTLYFEIKKFKIATSLTTTDLKYILFISDSKEGMFF